MSNYRFALYSGDDGEISAPFNSTETTTPQQWRDYQRIRKAESQLAKERRDLIAAIRAAA